LGKPGPLASLTDDELLAEFEAARRGEAMTPAAERAFARWLEIGGDLDLLEKPPAQHGGQLGLQDLDGHFVVVPDVVREVHGRHTAGAEFTLDSTAVGEGGGEAGGDFGQGRTR
jgi:hypothetical protein